MDPKWKEAERGLRIRELELFCKKKHVSSKCSKGFLSSGKRLWQCRRIGVYLEAHQIAWLFLDVFELFRLDAYFWCQISMVWTSEHSPGGRDAAQQPEQVEGLLSSETSKGYGQHRNSKGFSNHAATTERYLQSPKGTKQKAQNGL